MRSRWLATLVLAATLLPQAASSGVKGDLNDDGRVDVADAMMLMRILRGELDPQTLDPEDVADVAPVVSGVGGDGGIDVIDALIMLRALRDDVDTDGLATSGENALGTSPFLADTEGDGWLDPEDPDPLVYSPPGVPGTLRIFDAPSDVLITWQPPAGETSHYLLHRYGTDGSYEYFVLDASTPSFSDTSVQSGVFYRYWIESVNSQGQQGEFVNCSVSDPSNTTLWLTGGLGPYPNPWFTAAADGGGAVTLSWEASPDPAVTQYRIWMSTTAVPLGETGDLTSPEPPIDVPTVSHQVGGLMTGVTYYFRITAIGPAGESNLESAKQVAVVVN